ncbi:MAG TPA: DUF3854 domain-containing protein [Actinomycetota bacterium]|nr:DUF3854 domain-containing protein [Actinomycetota bacterium]
MALKVRRDDDSGEHPRYLYVSSIGHSGPGPEAPVHVPRWDGDTARLRLTEGELKADVATALSGMLTVSVPGVSAWRGALPVLRHLAPTTVHLAFDADAVDNPHVARAAEATAEALASEGWEVAVESWDGALAKGIDDALAAGVPIVTTMRTPRDPAPDPTTNGAEPRPAEGPYRASHDGLMWTRPTKDGSVETRLTDFVARIATDVVEDDGVETRRRFEVEARLNGWCRRFTIPADAFAAMGWATERSDVDWGRLTDCQAHAGAGHLAQALAGFLRWMAGRYEATQSQFAALLPELRDRAAASGEHRRTPATPPRTWSPTSSPTPPASASPPWWRPATPSATSLGTRPPAPPRPRCASSGWPEPPARPLHRCRRCWWPAPGGPACSPNTATWRRARGAWPASPPPASSSPTGRSWARSTRSRP